MNNYFSNLLAILIFAGVEAYAVPDVSFDAMTGGEGENVNLGFTIKELGGGSTRVTLVDNDGVGTLAVLHYMLVQKPSFDIYLGKAKWEDLKNQPVEGWNKHVRDTVLEALERARKFYETNKRPREAKELETILKKLESLKDAAPDYEQLNEIGNWLDK